MRAKMPDKRTATSKRCLLKQTCARYVVADPWYTINNNFLNKKNLNILYRQHKGIFPSSYSNDLIKMFLFAASHIVVLYSISTVILP